MEIVAALPPELAAIADPSARGAKPLLRPLEAETDPLTAVAPFGLYLALLTGPFPGGEVSPPAGNALPVATPETPALPTVEAAPSAVAALSSPALAALTAGHATTHLTDPASPPVAGVPVQVATLVLGGASARVAELPSAPWLDGTAVVAQLDASADAAMQPAPAMASTDPLEAVAPAEFPVGKPSVPSWLAALSARSEPQQAPGVASPPDSRAASAVPGAVPVTAGAPSLRAAAPRSEALATTAVLQPAQPVDTSSSPVSLAGAAEPSAFGHAEWLPAAGTGGGAPSATAAAAPPGTPVDLRSPSGPEAFASRVQWLVDQHVGEAHLKLNPPELGAVEVKISLVDDKTFVHLTTATSAARDELAQSLPRLRELFTMSGLELGGASVHGREGRHDGGPHSHGRAMTGSPAAFVAAADGAEAPPRWQRHAAGRIDVFA
jgi:flagellar hook-length control protein FliK